MDKVVSKSVDYLDGYTPTSWTKLTTLMKLHSDFYTMAMRSGNDPDIFLVKMECQQMLMSKIGVEDDQQSILDACYFCFTSGVQRFWDPSWKTDWTQNEPFDD
jgi:hypothetical protein